MSKARGSIVAATLWAGLGLLGCKPSGEAGFCEDDDDCIGRGQACDMVMNTCFVEEFSPTSTESPAPSEFTGKIVPLFRGRVCAPREVKSGANFPVSLEGCFHPCLQIVDTKFKHFFECVGSSCLAHATMWVTADSAAGGCPADAFAKFDRNACAFVAAEFSVNTAKGAEDKAVEGSMLLEIPYLTNADMEAVVAADNEDRTREIIEQYPLNPDRIPGERAIWVLPDLPEPPETCVGGGSGCACDDIGF